METSIVIDTGPDFRQQMLSNKIKNIDAVLITHEHNDHIIGVDDIRPFNFAQGRDMPFYALSRVIEDLKNRFGYVFAEEAYPGAPRIKTYNIEAFQKLLIGDLEILCLPITHGNLSILGFKIADFVYITDASFIDDRVLKMISDCKVLVLNALHKRPHYSHFNLEQALSIIDEVKPEKAYLTHLSHFMGEHLKVSEELPKNVYLAYDGLKISVS